MQNKESKQIESVPECARDALYKRRLGHLACSTNSGKPLVVPICFAFDGTHIYSAIDEKPKRSDPLALRRVVNITENSKVSFIIDDYSENWRKLQYVLIDGTATVLTQGRQVNEAISLLRRKYSQYHSMRLEGRPIIRIKPLRIAVWRGGD